MGIFGFGGFNRDNSAENTATSEDRALQQKINTNQRLVDLYNKTPNKTHIAILNEDGDIEYVDNNGNKVEF